MLFQFGVMKVVGIDCHDWSQSVSLRNLSEHDGGFALEAADLNDDAATRCAGGHHTQEPGLILEKETGDLLGGRPCIVQSGFEPGRYNSVQLQSPGSRNSTAPSSL